MEYAKLMIGTVDIGFGMWLPKHPLQSLFEGKEQVIIVIQIQFDEDESYLRENMVIMIQLRFQLKKVDVRSMFRMMAIKFLACGSPYLMVMSSFKDL